MQTLNQKDDGYRGIWYANQPSRDEFAYKYSGGLGTYCAKHQPFAIYSPEANKTFFCYGGTTKDDYRQLQHMVSCYDHETGKVPRPTRLLDKETQDAHDNPVISLDGEGYIWIFSTSHGISRPSWIHRSRKPYDIDEFERVDATREVNGEKVPFENFSYMQTWHVGDAGFLAFVTHYNDPADRTSFFVTSRDGVHWSQWRRLAAIEEGHYQISAAGDGKAGVTFNYHPNAGYAGNARSGAGRPRPVRNGGGPQSPRCDAPPSHALTKQSESDVNGLNRRTNLYYMETNDSGTTWQNANGTVLELPVVDIEHPALAVNYRDQGLNVYLKDIQLDREGHPVILHVTSKGYEVGPQGGPRIWRTARWTGTEWEVCDITESDSNYDTGSLYIENSGLWRVIAPTEPGPQPFNPGGEVVMWTSADQGSTWTCVRQMTQGSVRNHNYVRRPVNAHPDFYGFWADGHGREPSESRLYFCNRDGDVRELPFEMSEDEAKVGL